jgi:tetratricopeptide (TPR) repeat protein
MIFRWKSRSAAFLCFALIAQTPESHGRPRAGQSASPGRGGSGSAGSGLSGSELTDCATDPLCRQLVLRARALSSDGRYAQALDAYEGAYALHPSPTLLVNIGRLQYKLGLPHEAAGSLTRALAQLPAHETEKRELVLRFLMDAQALAAKTPPPGSAAVRVNIQPLPAVKVESPFYRRWPFWTTVGALVGLGITGLSLGAAAVSAGKPPDEERYLAVPVMRALTIRLP